MPFQFSPERWEDDDGRRHDGEPPDLSDTYGVFVHAYDPGTGENEYFWAFVYEAFDTWDEWLAYIGALMEMYGMSLA